jgi:hypothetical protein
MFRILILLLIISSCEKDDFIGNSVEPVKVTEIKKEGNNPPKKRKFRLFKKKRCKVPKSQLKISSLND